MKKFSYYTLIGCSNTAIHWIIFAALIQLSFSQALSNTIAFLIAATWSFILNAKFTFKAQPSAGRYFFFIAGMAIISALTGLLGDTLSLHPAVTVIAFSLISLVVGYLYSKHWVFRSHRDNTHRSRI